MLLLNQNRYNDKKKNQRIENYGNMKPDIRKTPSYWKFTGETVIVLFASKMIVPFTVGSFLLVLNKADKK